MTQYNEQRKVIIFGGAGYIGTAVVYELLNAGYIIDIVDDMSSGHDFLPKDSRVRLLVGKHQDYEFLCSSVFKESDIPALALVILSGSSVVQESVLNPLKYYENNVTSLVRILQALNEHYDRYRTRECNNRSLVSRPFIIFSSSATSKNDCDTKKPSEQIFMSPYGKTKKICEELLHDCANAYDMTYVALRYFNVSGAHSEMLYGELHDPETHLIARAIRFAMGALPESEEKLCLHGTDYTTQDGTCIRDYVHVDDIARAHSMVMTYLMKGGTSRIFDLGSGQGTSVRCVLNVVEEVVGKPIQFFEGPRRAGDVPVLVADITDAINYLGWRPLFSDLRNIITTSFRFYEHNFRLIKPTRHSYISN